MPSLVFQARIDSSKPTLNQARELNVAYLVRLRRGHLLDGALFAFWYWANTMRK